MRGDVKKRIRSRKGFTLAEVLMAVLIVVMVAGVVAAGVPVAIRAYRNIVEAGNAELLLSTTMTRLRDELGTATDITIDSSTGKISYKNAAGSQTELTLGTDGIRMQEYVGLVEGDEAEKYNHLLVSFEAAGKTMMVTYKLSGDAYDKANGILTIKDLTVKRGSDTMTKIDTFKIRVLAD